MMVAKNLLPIHIAGCWFRPPLGDEVFEGIRRGQAFEQHERAFTEAFLAPGMTFWDIGAHLGLYTVLGAKAVGPRGAVLAAEPDPSNRRGLRINLLLNRQWHVRIVANAVGERVETADFCSCRQGAYSGLKVAKVPAAVRKITVQKTTLDALAERYDRPAVDFMKMDVEGAELLVLQGGQRFFEDFPRPVLMCEFSDRRSVAFGHRCTDIYNWLAARDYRWFSFGSNGKLTGALPQAEYDYENLVACPSEKLERFSQWFA